MSPLRALPVPAPARPAAPVSVPVGRRGDAHEREAERVASAAAAMETPSARAVPPLAAPTAGDALAPGAGHALPESARRWAEPRLGWGFGQVRVHADAAAAAHARSMGARAYAVGRHLVFGAGAYEPDTARGRTLLAHELAHVVQQAGAPGGGGAQGAAAVRAASPLAVRRQELDVTPATPFATAQGQFFRFPADRHHTNQTGRPQFVHPAAAMQPYTGTGGGHADLHPAVHDPMNRMLTAMHAEGVRIDDQGLQSAYVQSGYRPTTIAEGRAYLRSLRRTITDDPATFTAPFPAALEAEAQSELGPVGSHGHNAFVAHLGAAPGWTPALARELVRVTGRFKAPRGGSTHHSGVVADIGFRYATDARHVREHGTDRGNNADAFRGAAGVWLNRFAPRFGFDTYSTSAEIWHQEWRQWQGTPADPDYVAPPPPPMPRIRLGPMTYREATEYTDCVRILGEGSRPYCRDAAAQAVEDEEGGATGSLGRRRRRPGALPDFDLP